MPEPMSEAEAQFRRNIAMWNSATVPAWIYWARDEIDRLRAEVEELKRTPSVPELRHTVHRAIGETIGEWLSDQNADTIARAILRTLERSTDAASAEPQG